jgi:hypothetical protein
LKTSFALQQARWQSVIVERGIYFAVLENPDVDAALFALHAPKGIEYFHVSPFEIEQPRKFYPEIVTPRIRVQEGCICGLLRSGEAARSGIARRLVY